MRKSSQTMNSSLLGQIDYLNLMSKKKNVSIWKDIAKRLSSSRKNRARVNVSRVARHTGKNEVAAVPGRVLGSGTIEHAVTVAALSFSNKAREKITKAGGQCIGYEDLVKKDPKGSNIRIME